MEKKKIEKNGPKRVTKKTPKKIDPKKTHQSVKKNEKKETAEKTNSKKPEIVPVINMFKLLPQAKFKLKKHIPPQSSPSISGKKKQKSLEIEKNKNKPKKSMANTGRQNPQKDLTFVFKNTESQYPLKRSSRKEKNNQAKGDSKMKKKM